MMDGVDILQFPEKCINGDNWDRHHSLSLCTNKGLRNPPGENNCFLNSAVQVFWHLDVFRRSYRRFTGHVCMANSCIFCALKVIFTQFLYSDKSSLPPNGLRRALAETFVDQHRFQLGYMDDAAECFENILKRIHFHVANNYNEDRCDAAHCLPHQKFALTVSDQVRCSSCGASSEPLVFSEMVHYVSVAALVSQAVTLAEKGTKLNPDRFGLLLRTATGVGDVRDCPKYCGKKVQIERTLLNQPDVVSVGLVWDSDRPDGELIEKVVKNIGTSIMLQDVFHSTEPTKGSQLPQLHLVGVVCYYGKHYSTFIFHSRLRVWVYFDDATVKELGQSWDAVAEKCCRGHYQPLLLLYANPNATPVSVEGAFQKTTMAPGYISKTVSTLQRSKSSDLQKGSSERQGDQTPVVRRAVTPTPEFHIQLDSGLQQRRAITPGPDTCLRCESDQDSVSSASTDHYRQLSYLKAMTKDAEQAHVESSKDKLLFGEYVYTSGMVRPSFGVPNLHCDTFDGFNQQGINDHYDNTPNANPATKESEINKSESFKKGNKIRTDFIRYVNSPQPGHLPNCEGPNRTEINNAEVFSYSGSGCHKVIKPKFLLGGSNYENINKSGLSTLPSNKEVQGHQIKSPQSQLPCDKDVALYKTPQQGHHLRPPTDSQAAKLKSSFTCYYQNNEEASRSMSRSISANMLSTNKRQLSSQGSRENLHDHNDDNALGAYIDRKVVENILNYQMRSLSTGKNSEIASVKEKNHGHQLKPDCGHSVDTGELTVDIPYDNESLESQRDSGYGSSDRNSSSSTSSVTMEPYVQYFMSRNMIPPKSLNREAVQQNVNKGKKPLSNMENRKEIYHQHWVPVTKQNLGNQTFRNTSVSSYTDQYKIGRPENFGYITGPSHINMPHERENLFQRIQGDNEVSLEHAQLYIKKEAKGMDGNHQPVTMITNNKPNPSPANGEDLINFKSGIQLHHILHENKVVSEDYFKQLNMQANDFMGKCLQAERMGDLDTSLLHCHKAIGCWRQVLELPYLSKKSVLLAQNKYQCCGMKLKSLQYALSVPRAAEEDGDLIGFYMDNQAELGMLKEKVEHLYQQQPVVVRGAVNGNLHASRGASQSVCNVDRIGNKQTACVSVSDAARSHWGRDFNGLHESMSSAEIYGTLPKNNGKPGEKAGTELYQAFLNKQRQLSDDVQHSRTNSTTSSDTIQSNGSNQHLRASKMSKHEIRQLLHQNMLQRQMQANQQFSSPQSVCEAVHHMRSSSTHSSSSSTDSVRTLTPGSQEEPQKGQSTIEFPSSDPSSKVFPPSTSTLARSPPQRRADSPYLCVQSQSVQPNLAKTGHLTEHELNHRENVRQQSFVLTQDKFSTPITSSVDCPGNHKVKNQNQQVNDQPSESHIGDEDVQACRPNVKAIVSKFDTVYHSAQPKPSVSDNEAEEGMRKHMPVFRQRSQSESSFSKLKSALSKHKNKDKPRKSVTFSNNIALIAAAELKTTAAAPPPYKEVIKCREMNVNATCLSDSDYDDSSSGSDEGLEDVGRRTECTLCHKTGARLGQAYCMKCSFYMSRFSPNS